MIVDAQGHAVSGATAESVALYDQAVRAYNLGYGDALGLFDTARQASPGFVMAHLGKAWAVRRRQRSGPCRPAASSGLGTAEGLAMNEREQAHLAALNTRRWRRSACRR